jgi:hypothetical protein
LKMTIQIATFRCLKSSKRKNICRCKSICGGLSGPKRLWWWAGRLGASCFFYLPLSHSSWLIQ